MASVSHQSKCPMSNICLRDRGQAGLFAENNWSLISILRGWIRGVGHFVALLIGALGWGAGSDDAIANDDKG